MPLSRRALQVAAGAVAGTAGAVVATLVGQVVWTVTRPHPTVHGTDISGTEGVDGPLVRIAVLGDSTLTGPGIAPHDVWVRQASRRLAHRRPSGLRIEVVSHAEGGARVTDVLTRQVPRLLADPTDIVVVAVGANDVIRATPLRRLGRDADRLVGSLVAVVPRVVVAGVGDLGAIPRVPRPLADVLRRRARAVSHRLAGAVVAHPPAVFVPADEADEVLREGPDAFAADRFHPNEHGHGAWARTIEPVLDDLVGEVLRERR